MSNKDPRVLSGEYTFYSKNKLLVKDKNNECCLIDKNDPRYLKGELQLFWIGRKHKTETCNKIKNTMAKHKHQQGKKNSHFGTCWICNLELKKSIIIKKEELEKFLSEGWIKGRKQKF